MFETIVWATDGSEVADSALPLVVDLARCGNARIVAVHANELLAGRLGGGPALADEDELRLKIEGQAEELRAEGLRVDLVLETSGKESVSELIADAAREVSADLIVIGTHGHGGFRSALVGSVTKALLHRAPCPVLAVPPVRVAEPVG
jgi:nucleotide-binding universal stress UspA family protein